MLPREADHKVIKQNKKICFEVISDRSELCPVVATVAVAEQRSSGALNTWRLRHDEEINSPSIRDSEHDVITSRAHYIRAKVTSEYTSTFVSADTAEPPSAAVGEALFLAC